MLSDDAQFAPHAVNGGDSLPRDVEFNQALERYMASYIAEQQRRRVQKPSVVQRFTAFTIGTFEGLGSDERRMKSSGDQVHATVSPI